MKSGYNDTLKSKSWNVLETVLSLVWWKILNFFAESLSFKRVGKKTVFTEFLVVSR